MSILNSGCNNPHYGKKQSIESCRRISAGHQGISYDEWEGFTTDNPYYYKFNELRRELNREKYDRRCFLCDKSETENITTTHKQRKLSVHHIDRNKQQGCDDIPWALVPLCMTCHGSVHNDLWESRIMWLLKNVWNISN